MSLHHFGFGSPYGLFALALVPALVLVRLAIGRKRVRYTASYSNLELLAGLVARRRPRLSRFVPLLLLALALASAAAAFARPRIEVTAPEASATVILLADVSGSMEATDVKPARLFAAITAMRGFVDGLPSGARVGLITFSDKVEVRNVPTDDHVAIDSGLAVISPEGGTALGAGVTAAVKLAVASLAAEGIRRDGAGDKLPAAIVLESDGAQNRGTITPFASAQVAKAAGVRIYAVALGTRHGYINQGTGLLSRTIQVPPDLGVVAMLARETGGQAFTATNAAELDGIYRRLGSSIVRRRVKREIASWFELAAGVLLLAGVASARLRGAALP